MSRVLSALVCPAVLSLVLAGVSGCTGGSDDGPGADASAVSTPLRDLDTTTLAVARSEFCDAIPQAAVEQAIGGPVESTGHYGNGDTAQLTGRVKDVSHELGCVFTAESGAQARAWVFVPPVTQARAKRLVRELGRAQGCRVVADAPKFGAPTLARVCDAAAGRPAEASFRGLFGDAWLTCSVSEPGAEADALLERADAWCVNVATSVAAG